MLLFYNKQSQSNYSTFTDESLNTAKQMPRCFETCIQVGSKWSVWNRHTKQQFYFSWQIQRIICGWSDWVDIFFCLAKLQILKKLASEIKCVKIMNKQDIWCLRKHVFMFMNLLNWTFASTFQLCCPLSSYIKIK